MTDVPQAGAVLGSVGARPIGGLNVIAQRLADHGYRMTAPRRRLLESMHEMGDHFDPEALRDAVPTVSRSTAFRTIRLLLNLGLACRVALPDGKTGYRLSEATPHQHAICLGCGAIQEVTSERLAQVLQRIAAPLGYLLTDHRLDVFGYCADCRPVTPLSGAEDQAKFPGAWPASGMPPQSRSVPAGTR